MKQRGRRIIIHACFRAGGNVGGLELRLGAKCDFTTPREGDPGIRQIANSTGLSISVLAGLAGRWRDCADLCAHRRR